MPQHPRPEQLLEAILASTEDAILTYSPDGAIQTWSPGAQRLYGYTCAEMVGQPLARLLPLYEAPSQERVLHELTESGYCGCENTERLHKDGSKVRVSLKRVAIRCGQSGDFTAILERAHPAECPSGRNRIGDPELRNSIEQMPLLLWTTDTNLKITSNWGSGLRAARIRPGAFVGRPVHEYLSCHDPYITPMAQHYEALRGTSSRFEHTRKDRVLEIHLAPLRDPSGEIIGCVGAALDITERKKGEQEVRYQATHDALTGLANYREFLDTLEREVRRAERSHHSFALLLLDLDGLKRINDRWGHLAGNRALKRLAEVMKLHCRSTDLAARYGGDEFAVLLIDADPGMARQIAERVGMCLQSDPEEPPLTVSIGASIYPHDGPTAQDLLEVADQQLYQRKKDLKSRGVSAH